MECQVEKLEHFPYVSIIYPSPVTIHDRNGRCWIHEPINDEQAEMNIWPPADLCGFGLEHTVPDFWTLLIECKCRTMVEWSQFVTFSSSRAHWRGSLWRSSWTWSVTNVKTILLKTRKPFFLPCALQWHCPHTRRKCFWSLPLLSPLYWTRREEYVGNVLISPLAIPFSSVHGSTHYFQMTNFNM